MFELVKLFLLATLALLAGAGIGKSGVLTGFAGSGLLDVRICGRRLVGQFVQFRQDKIFYKLALTPA